MNAALGETTFILQRALLPTGIADAVQVTIVDGRFTSVVSEARPASSNAQTLNGLTIPGLANCHSHAFHRALRGRTQRDRGTFWTWRQQMYSLAQRLDPDNYFTLARAVYREMVAAGITTVGEFHYVHHQTDGRRYADPNAMGHALIEAALEAGIRITLLDTCYLAAGIGKPPEGVQQRFSDGDVDAWHTRTALLSDTGWAKVAQAFHSVRAVPRDQLQADPSRPLHVHLSEQKAENEECLQAYGLTPTQLLAEEGQLGPHTSLVHATHLTQDDISTLGEASAYVDFCPTTERDLGDGIGPSRLLHDAGARLTLGSDSHAIIDPFEEMRALELNERLATQQRGHWSAPELLEAATATGHTSLGWDDAGHIAVGARADMVTLSTTSPRTAGTGCDENTVVFSATSSDVVQVMVDGRIVAGAGLNEDLGKQLQDAIDGLWK